MNEQQRQQAQQAFDYEVLVSGLTEKRFTYRADYMKVEGDRLFLCLNGIVQAVVPSNSFVRRVEGDNK